MNHTGNNIHCHHVLSHRLLSYFTERTGSLFSHHLLSASTATYCLSVCVGFLPPEHSIRYCTACRLYMCAHKVLLLQCTSFIIIQDTYSIFSSVASLLFPSCMRQLTKYFCLSYDSTGHFSLSLSGLFYPGIMRFPTYPLHDMWKGEVHDILPS